MKATWIGIVAVCFMANALFADTQTINGVQYQVQGERLSVLNGVVYDVYGNGGYMKPAHEVGVQTVSALWTSINGGACWRYNGQPPSYMSISGGVPYGYAIPPN